MTTSRIVRGTKIRIFLCFCAIVIILGLLACYNNTISQLDETQKAVALCHQQQENLSTQLQVISDYKLRLEKALKTEKAEHVKSNSSFDQSLKDEKSRNEKNMMEAKLRFNSLQQRYNLLQTEHDDYKEKILKTQQEQLDEIGDLQSKLKEAQEEIKKVISSKEKLKSDYLNIQRETDSLRKQVEGHELNSIGNENKTNYLQKQNIDLKREINLLKEKCPDQRDTIQEPIILNDIPKTSQKEIANQDQGQQNDQNVLAIPLPNNEGKNNKGSSSTPSSIKSSSQGNLNGARPLAVPTMTPKSQKNESGDVSAKHNGNAVPQGVLPVPENLPEDVVPAEENEVRNNMVDERYKNKIDESKIKKQEEMERENMGNEDLDQQNIDEGLNFGDAVKHAEKQNKEHIDNLGVFKEQKNQQIALGVGDYKDGQVEENPGMDEAEDDDQDEYGDHLARHKEPAVRN
ncbi:CAP-Gly domain-containing linker protein 1 homolog [Coccinella septempunctata]|uniref:CAP-Gly domain-containing linker protein 1 homolog n=1 Tax=Coccinella septempunctata TaxID=41139 RepID=UPI001D098B45|nr:CAP-Gly domain-containing linker protein 1 homolog [Coccinella septempunctata]